MSARQVFWLYNGVVSRADGMTWQSLLVPFTLFLILLVVVLVFIPAYLERLSRVNLTRRAEYYKLQKKLDREERRLERLLASYRRAKAEVYRSAVGQIDEQLAQIRAEISGIDQLLDTLQCPQLFDYLFPIQHFSIAPGHITSILNDSRILKRVKLQLDTVGSRLVETKEMLDRLSSLPIHLQRQHDTLVRQVESIDAVIARERNEGIEALDDFVRDVVSVRRLISQADPIFRQESALPEMDAAALALQQAEAALVEADLRATELERERVALDRRVRRAATDLDNVQAVAKSGPGTDLVAKVRPMLRRAAALLNESAQDHRRRREFNTAGADVTTAVQLIAFSRDLLSAHQQVQLLVERDDGASLSASITALKAEMTELLDLIDNGSNGHDDLAGAAVAGQAARVRTRADTLVRRQDASIAELHREAIGTKEGLDRAWNEGQSLLSLSLDDPLARRYAHLETKFEEAQQRPAALEAYRHEVAAFEGIWGTWVTRVQVTRARIGRMREALPNQIDLALTLAEPWACLTEDLKFIQQRAADFENLRSRFDTSRHRRETESIMDQLEVVEGEIADRVDQLRDRAARLTYLESDVTQILKLASGKDGEIPADAPERPRWDRVSGLIDHHIRSAHVAMHYEDASVALLRAAEAANKLAI